MKTVGLVLLILGVCFLFEFSLGNLKAPSFFLKIGCNNQAKEYSLFVETGCKNKEVGVSAPIPGSIYDSSSRNAPITAYQSPVAVQEIVPRAPLVVLPTPAASRNLYIPTIGEDCCGPFMDNCCDPDPCADICCDPCIDDCCSSFPWPKRITIRHVIGNQGACLPFASNFTTYEMFFAPDYQCGCIMPFLDLRGHRFDNSTYAANIGIGGRGIPGPCSCLRDILGFNAYYDYRQGCIGYFQQLGLGIEILGGCWDFRANAYVPFGNKHHIRECFFDDFEGDFFAFRRDIESVSYSFNGEIGAYLFSSECFSLYLAMGPYFLARGKCARSTPGGEIRIQPQYKDYFAVDLSWRHDSLFKTIWQAEIIFNLPLYRLKDRSGGCGICDKEIYQRVERFEVMPLSKRTCWLSNF